MYFITICTKNKKCILSEIKNEYSQPPIKTIKQQIVGVAPLGDPQIKLILSSKGKIINQYINNYNKKFNNIKINDYVIMPNHIHIIIELIGSPKAATPTIPKIINSFKSIITKQIGYSIWQRNYYEHIIRNETELQKIQEYIKYNPMNWTTDRYY